jgi:membrane protein DedA with SNARE-associated domain
LSELYITLLSKFSYLGLFLVLIAAGLGVPLPEDIPLLAAGWLVHHGKADLALMIITGMLGVMVGDSMLFFMGRRYGDHIVDHRWLKRIAKPWLLEKARSMYTNHGAKILFAARFMPGIRSVMFLTAGVFKVPFWKFFIIDGFAALISVPLWVWVGAKFSGHLEAILGAARLGTYGLVGLLVLALTVWGIYEYRHNLKQREVGRQAAADGEIRSAPLAPDKPANKDATSASGVIRAGLKG